MLVNKPKGLEDIYILIDSSYEIILKRSMSVIIDCLTKKIIDIGSPDIELSVREIFGLDTDLKVPAYSKTNESRIESMSE